MKRALSIVVFLLVTLSSCATASAYSGPVSDKPLLEVVQRRHFEMVDPRLPQQLVTISIARATNASTKPMHLRLECTETLAHFDAAPRSTTEILLAPKDSSCELTEVGP